MIKPVEDRVQIKPAGFRFPRTRYEWGSLLLGVSAILHGLGRLAMGETEVSVWVEISAGLGTFGFPSLVGRRAHIEVVADRPMDMTQLNNAAAEIAEGMRVGGPDDDTDDLPRRVKPVAEVRRADEI